MTFFVLQGNHNWREVISKSLADEESGEWVSGQWAQAIEGEYDKQVGIRQFAINFWIAVNYVVFGEGKAGLEIGQGNWLFSTEEYDNTPIHAEVVVNNLKIIRQMKQTIEANNGQLIIALIPAKARVYDKQLSKGLPKHARVRYEQFSAWLNENHIANIGLLSALLNNDNNNEGEAFISNDTHWSPYGARVSAEYIAVELKKRYPMYPWGTHKFKTQRIDVNEAYDGDLLNYLPLEPYFASLAPAKPMLVRYETSDTQEVSLFDHIEYDAVLVGTSYSAKQEWNFVGALQQYTGINIFDASQIGNGPFKPMLDYIASDDYRENKSKLVIWEIPERYIVSTSHVSG